MLSWSLIAQVVELYAEEDRRKLSFSTKVYLENCEHSRYINYLRGAVSTS